MSQLNVSSSDSNYLETDTTDNESDISDVLNTTPRKKRYQKSIKHGLSYKRARYHSKSQCSNLNHISPQENPMVYEYDSSRLDSESDDSSDSYVSSDCSLADTSPSDFTSLSEWSESDSSFGSEENVPFEHAEHTNMYDGCHHSYLTSYTMVMLYVMKHSLSKDAFTDLLLLISTHLPASSKYFKSIYKVKEFLKEFINLKEPTVHTLCENCNRLLKGESCTSEVCSRKTTKIVEFHDLHLEDQLRDLFQDSHFCDLIERPKKANRDLHVNDISDGNQYKDLLTSRNDEGNVLNLTLTMNTDGVSLFSSSKKGNLWPIYVAINEIPIKLRFSKKYILPSFLYCHSEKPNMLSYMIPQMEILKKLSDKGIEVVTPNGKLLIKAHLLAVSVDLPAKAMVANMKQFNGKFGCSFCMDEGESRPNCPMHRFWPFQENSTLRTHQSYLSDVMEAVRSKKAVNGVKGASPLVVLRYVDIPKVFVVDWMHCVLLGVTKSLMKLWFTSSNHDERFYVGDKMAYLNQRLQKIEIPDFMSRVQRNLEDHAHWKASECREWLLHFSVPVLEGILPNLAHVHYMLLVSAMNLLNKESLLMSEIDYAEMLLLDFCRLMPELYGRIQQTMNVHLLKHLPQFVRLYGPLFNTSCFGFESMNSHLKSMVHGTRFINSQVGFAVGMTKALPQLVKKFKYVHADVQSLALRLTSKLIRSDYREEESLTDLSPVVIGKPTRFHPTVEENEVILNCLGENRLIETPLLKFLRLKKDKETFYSQEYKRAKTRNSYTVLLDTSEIVIVLFYVSISDQLFAMVENMTQINPSFLSFDADVLQNDVLRKYTDFPLCQHIKEVKFHKEFQLVPVSSISKKCVYMKLNKDKTYVSIPPNLLEHN